LRKSTQENNRKTLRQKQRVHFLHIIPHLGHTNLNPSKGGKEMRKLILILLALVLLATNPNKENYIDYTKQNILGHNPSGLVSILADPLIDKTTTESNLYFATVYRTKFGESNVTTLGVLNKFIPLK